MFLLISSAVLIQILQGVQKTDQMHEVNEGGTNAMIRIMTTIRNAESVTTPTQGTTSPKLILAMPSPSANPTIFVIEDELIKIKEGTSATTTLTADEVRVTDIQFTNTGSVGSPDSVHVEFTIESQQTDVGVGEPVSKIFRGSGTIRKRL